ncbi:acyl-CoA carboxylase subunit epsilon [Streptomyces sp. NPDC017993]|uniref:acyl-CoA carboxylase subunit epsilon n=1 Tax=Streptomyces sp. NPDC017993 TaxID=3365027 RepID=UPI00379AFE68
MSGPQTPALRVVRGNPTPEEVAVLTVALMSLTRASVEEPDPARPPHPMWPRAGEAAPAADAWAARPRPGWRTP